ncbi:hypothetical protein [Salinigranum marinum]|uniref:hypothetical protein n=1 Tax=Salinigranum marinum TaxID=1515595 RepID=UPI002989E939|nr:hypothetical protein [Salinigranum marinum]
MSPPPDDHERDPDDGADERTPDAAAAEPRDRPDEPSAAEFDAPTEDEDTVDARRGDDARAASDASGPSTPAAETTTESLRRTLDGVLPAADVDSRWWYWIAAVPVYFLVTFVGGAVAAVLFVFAGLLDVLGLGGLASFSTFVLFGGVAALFGLVGVVVAFAFPVAVYVDARAIEAAGGEWQPDPVLWGLVAVVAVLVTNFVLSVPLALYYLYKRHEELGTP